MRVASHTVIQKRLRQRSGEIQANSAATKRVEEKRPDRDGSRGGCPGRFEIWRLGVGEEIRKRQELRVVACYHGGDRAVFGREVARCCARGNGLADL